MIWALWNGDECQNMYYALIPQFSLWAIFYMCLWIWFANQLIHNQFLAVIEEGYVEQTKVEIFDWLEKDFQD